MGKLCSAGILVLEIEKTNKWQKHGYDVTANAFKTSTTREIAHKREIAHTLVLLFLTFAILEMVSARRVAFFSFYLEKS